jgi:tetratricopeptide (TPR) repeat protein
MTELVSAGFSFVLALALRLAFVVQTMDDPFLDRRMVDEIDYHQMAQRFVQGAWPGPEALFRPPLHPLFLGCVYRLVGDGIFDVKLVQVAVGALVAPLTGWLATRALGSARAGLVAGLLVACNGTLVYYDADLLAASLDVLLVTAALAAIVRADAAARYRDWAIAGLVTGLAAANRGEAVLLVPVVAAWSVLGRNGGGDRVGWQRVGRRLTVFAGSALLVVSPIAWHNARYDANPEGAYSLGLDHRDPAPASFAVTLGRIATGRYSPLGWADGVNLYIGNVPEERGPNRYDDVRHFRRYLELEAEPWKHGAATAHEHSAWFRHEALAHVASRPGAWLALMGRKALDAVNGFEIPRGTNLYADRSFSAVLAALLWDGPIRFPAGVLLPLGLAGGWVLRRDRRCALLGLALLVQLGFVAAFFVTARYRAPALPIATVLAVGLVARVALRARAGMPWSGGEIACAVAVALLVAIANVRLSDQSTARSANEHYELAGQLVAESKVGDALEHYRAAVAMAPAFSDAHNNIGRLLQNAGDVNGAIPEYTSAIRSDPRNVQAVNNLGTSLLTLGDASGAERAFRQALAIDPSYGRARQNLDALLASRPVAPDQ